ncbi:hypothetical protein RRG08_041289 [Elysia crispata]|uniref:Secreted protein n=1 Tax=Elysia crispata TaxID=231223 RepID=A0AAE0YLD7_9GAST|nr:hypothetical protein RRG08_041289 [Elysia crispata]
MLIFTTTCYMCFLASQAVQGLSTPRKVDVRSLLPTRLPPRPRPSCGAPLPPVILATWWLQPENVYSYLYNRLILMIRVIAVTVSVNSNYCRLSSYNVLTVGSDKLTYLLVHILLSLAAESQGL